MTEHRGSGCRGPPSTAVTSNSKRIRRYFSRAESLFTNCVCLSGKIIHYKNSQYSLSENMAE